MTVSRRVCPRLHAVLVKGRDLFNPQIRHFASPQGSEVPVPRCPAQQVPEVPGSGSTARSDGGPLSV